MNRRRAISLIVILSLILSGILFINYNMTKPTKLNKIIANKYGAPANSAFDDQNFYNCIVNEYNSSSSKKISYTTNMSDSQLKSIKNLYCYFKNIKSAKGIEKLTNLTLLDVRDNQLTNIDVSKNINLDELHVSWNQLTDIDVSKNVKLTDLDVLDNKLTNIDVSKNVNLEKLDVTSNQLTNLDISKNVNLSDLYVRDNKLTNLDISKNTYLRNLYVGQNQLTSLDVSNKAYLEILDIRNNQLTDLDIHKSLNLNFLNASINQLTNIDVSENVNLTSLTLFDNQLTNIDVSKNVKLEKLDVSWNQLTNIDVSENVNLDDFDVGHNQLTNIEVSKNTNLISLTLLDNQLTNVDVSKNVNLTYLGVSWNQLTNIDVSKNVNLENLNVFKNQLTNIDVSKNINLDDLDVYDNQLTNIDLSKNVNLINLDVSNNELTNLDLSYNSKLESIDVGDNQLTSLDVSDKAYLTDLEVYKNQLTNIDVSKNVNLEKLDVSWNQLTDIDVSKNVKLTHLYVRDNQLTNVDVSKNINLDDLDVYDNQLTNIDLSKNVNLINLDVSNNELTNLDLSYNSKLESIDVGDNQLTNLVLKNIKKLSPTTLTNNVNQSPNLKNLTLGNNDKLTNVSISNSNLENIDLGEQQNLKTVIVNKNPKLSKIGIGNAKSITRLILNNNALIKEGLTGLNKLSNLYELNLNNNNIKTINITGLTNLITFEISNQRDNDGNKMLTSVVLPNDNAVEKKNKLENLNVSNNNLPKINLSKSTSLKKVSLGDNPYNLGMLTTVVENSINVSTFIDTDVIKLNNNMTKKFKAAYVNDVLQNVDANNNITIPKVGTYNYKIEVIVSLNGEEETITGTYTINAKDITLLSEKYKVNNEKGYIYTKLDTNSNTILSNLKVDGEEGTIEIKDNKVLIKNSNKVVREYKILNITKTNYDLSKEYIYTKIIDFDISKITTNCELTNINNTLEIGYDGEIFNTYKIVNIKSDYKIYGKWIYIIGEFDINKIATINATLTDNNGVLEVKYNDEVIDSLAELKIDFGSLKVNKDKIVPGEIKEYTEFMKNIKSDKLEVKLYKGTTLITKGNIEEGMTLKVISSEYGEIMTYTITKEYVDLSKLEIDEKNYIKKYNVGTTYEEIRKEIDTSGSVKFVDNSGKELENSDIIRTGSKVVIELSTETKEYTIVVYGDINGDGKITMSDLVKSANYLIDETIISEDCYKEAIDVTKDGNIRMSDIIKLSNILIGGNQ